MSTTRLPAILELVARRGHTVFTGRMDPNLVVERGPGLPDDWDGLLHYAYRPGTESGWTIHTWPCATRPGGPFILRPMNPDGVAVLRPGQYRGSHRPGLHHGRNALVQVRPVTVDRFAAGDVTLTGGRASDVGLFGVNVHDVSSPRGLAGCIGLSALHMAELLEAHARTIPYSGTDVSLTLVVP